MQEKPPKSKDGIKIMDWDKVFSRVGFSEFTESGYLIHTFMTKMLYEILIDRNKKMYKGGYRGYSKLKFDELVKELKLDMEKHFIIKEEMSGQIFHNFYDEKGDRYISIGMRRTTEKEKKMSVIYLVPTKEEEKRIQDIGINNFYTKKENTIYMLTAQAGNYSFSDIGSIDAPLERRNYTDKVMGGFDHIAMQLIAKEPRGRLTILSGPAGTGKTYFVKGLVNELGKDCTFIFLPAKFISELDGPTLIPALLNQKYSSGGKRRFYFEDISDDATDIGDATESGDEVEKADSPLVFIIEDADACLVPRGGDNISLISSLLNYTDGIFGTILDLRIIATTNANKLKFDKALTRPGRLCKHIAINKLKPEKANEIYNRLTDGGDSFIFEKDVTLGEVYNKAFGDKTFEEDLLEEEKDSDGKVGFF